MGVIFVFVDGLGLAPRQKSNPFYTVETPFLNSLLCGKGLIREAAGKEYEDSILLELDAGLGVRGLPQSATGQTSLFCGVNAPRILGTHLRGFPNNTLREILSREGMFLQLKRKDLTGTFANAYRPFIFRELQEGISSPVSCSTLITYYGGLKLRSLEDLQKGQAVYMDITHELLQSQGFKVTRISPREAGKRLARLSRGFDLTLYEYFLSDIAGHKGDYTEVKKIITTLDEFIESLVQEVDLEEDLLIITSDHGNLEDISENNHTSNPVPALLVGNERKKLALNLQQQKNISAVLPSLLKVLLNESTTFRTGSNDPERPTWRCFP